MSNAFPFDVFLSHNAKDKPRVRPLAERLRAAGVRVWFDDWIIKPGDDIYLAVERGLAEARVQVLCMSPHALGSEWVGLERSTVLFRDPGNVGRRFVPLLLADCDLPDTLRRYKYVDYRKDAGAAFEELLIACRGADQQEPSREEAKAASAALPEAARPAGRKGEPPATPPNREQKVEQGNAPAPAAEGTQPEPLAVLERTLKKHENWVRSVAVSPDGTWAASGSDDQTVKIWGLETGACRMTLQVHTKQVNCVAITPDGKRILSGSHDVTIRVWDAADGQPAERWEANDQFVLSIVALSDGKRAISGGADGLGV